MPVSETRNIFRLHGMNFQSKQHGLNSNRPHQPKSINLILGPSIHEGVNIQIRHHMVVYRQKRPNLFDVGCLYI